MGAMALSPSSKYLQRAADPVDDVERESLTATLNAAFADGRLPHDAYTAAMDVVYAARTLGELVPVVEQLPAAPVAVPAIIEPSRGPVAGSVNQARSLVSAGLVAGAAAVVLVIVVLTLIGVLIF